MTNEVTVMMVTFNRLELTKRMLENFFKCTKQPYNLVVVDNGSIDGTPDYLDDLFSSNLELNAVFIKNNENKGIAIGRNQALKAANEHFPNAEWFCTIDNDVEVPDGWLDECIGILKANPKYGMIGVNMERKPYPIVNEGGKTFQSKPQGNLGTACMVFPKSLHKMLGFFNTEYGTYGEEDADMGMRARVLGYKLGYIEKMGNHFGEGENDVGEYREFKTMSHKRNLAKFNENCRLYAQRKKNLYIPFKD